MPGEHQIISTMIVIIGALALVYLILRSVYRVYFHPLAGIPGPKIAAISYLHEFYHDAIRQGRFIWEIEKMHEKYGPIVRINPGEVHISDPTFYDQIYTGTGRKRDKDEYLLPFTGGRQSALQTIDHNLHRARRNQLKPFFSQKAVHGLEGVLGEKLALLCQHLERAHAQSTPVRLDTLFTYWAADVITHRLYGRDAAGVLSDPELKGHAVWESLSDLISYLHMFRFFPVITQVVRYVPKRLMCMVWPCLSCVYDLQEQVVRRYKEVAQGGKMIDRIVPEEQTLFDALAHPSVPAAERSLSRVRDESLFVIFAGTENSSATLSFAIYHLLQNKDILARLRDELDAAIPSLDRDISVSELEKLPYLTAVVNEALRLAAPPTRSARVATEETLHFNDHVLPPGTRMSTISYFLHRNPSIFGAPGTFDPERWIRAKERGVNLTKYLVPFSRGVRSCVGINLAYAELYMGIATVVRRFDLEIYDTLAENMAFAREVVMQRPEKGVWRLNVRVVGVRSF